jgi:hypothetical protein
MIFRDQFATAYALRTVAHNSQRNSAPFVHDALRLMMAGLDPAAMEVARRRVRHSRTDNPRHDLAAGGHGGR